MKKILFFLVFLPFMVIKAQTTNNIQKITYKVASTSAITTPSVNQANQNVTHFDGLGRPMQSIEVKAGGNSEDIVTPITYDNFGRQTKDYLPYAATSNDGVFRTDALSAINTFYNTSKYEYTYNPFSEKQFEASPLNRVLKQAAPGVSWALGSGHEIKMDYQTNIANEVRNFKVSLSFSNNTYIPTLTDAGFYAPNELYKTVTYDENTTAVPLERNGSTVEFKNKQGQVVLKRTYGTVGTGTSNEQHDTYYVYDDFGNLTYVLPPKMTTESVSIISVADNYEYQSDWFEDYPNLFVHPTYDNDISVSIYDDGYFDITINAYADDLQFKDGFIMNLDFISPTLPDIDLGHVTFGNGNDAGSAYISSGNLYINSSGLSDTTTGYFYGSFYFDLSTLQSITSTSSTIIGQTVLDDLAYQYKYDDRNRLVEKKLPGKDWEYIVYDKLDRPVLTQDANLRAQNKWLFTKYDVFGRVAYTGLINSNNTRITMQSAADGTSSQYVTQSTTATTIAGTSINYNNGAYPILAVTDEIHTIHYYDNYDFDIDGGNSETVGTNPQITPTTATKGLATGSKIRVLGENSWITNVIYYDAKGRPIYNYSNNNYLGVVQKVKNELDFVGKPIKTTTTHKRNNVTATVVDNFSYDPQGRLLTQIQKINNQADELIVSNVYDELGQLTQKGVGGKTTQSRLQTIDYTYNIRGWLKGINDGDSSNSTITVGSGDLFGFQINYNNPTNLSKALYNGNISQTFWKTANTDNSLKNYIYSYDALNRLTSAVDNLGKLNETVSYDKNGNIINLTRLGEIVGGSTVPDINNASHFGVMDNLKYTYDSGNKLQIVSDSADDTYGFKDDYISSSDDTTTDYTYDANGNMKTDTNKGITAISYNHLNLPISVTLAGGTINYYYDATGVKQRKEIGTTITDYAGGFQYEGSDLKNLPQAEGYVAHNNGVFSYIYQYKDHLGNVRLSYGDSNNDGSISSNSEIIEENNYYPFGLKHKGYNSVTVYGQANAQGQKYKYNGKELQDELGLNMYDYGNRNYDASIGRFHNIDRFSEKYLDNTPYHYTKNNPVFFIDVKGDSIAVYRPNGSYWKTIDDGKKEWSGRYYSKSKEIKKDGEVIGHKYSGMVNFEFADPESDTKDIQNTQIVYVDEKKIADMLGEAGALDPKNRYSFSYMNKESKGGGKLDFSYSSIPYNFAGASKDPLNNPSSMLFLPKGDNIAHNHMNFGNFLWGAAGSTLGFTRGTLQAAAHYNSLMNSDTNGYSPQLDSSDDQRSIKAGVSYSQEHQFINRTWSPSAGISPKPER